MQQECVKPDIITFVGMNACATVVALEEGWYVNQQIIQRGLESDVLVRSSFVEMYAKSGSMEAAWRAFNKMPSRNVVSWNAILGGYSMHSHGKEALKHFERMCKVGVQPNDITFVCLLSACSHAGLVDEGMHCYDFIDHNLYDFCKIGHCTCMVDVLGSPSHLEEAETPDTCTTLRGKLRPSKNAY
jgi:pentatricopeptide repeat protein